METNKFFRWDMLPSNMPPGTEYANGWNDCLAKVKSMDLPWPGAFWIWDGYTYDAPWECSNCHKMHDEASEFCPHCGAVMKVIEG